MRVGLAAGCLRYSLLDRRACMPMTCILILLRERLEPSVLRSLPYGQYPHAGSYSVRCLYLVGGGCSGSCHLPEA